MPRNAPAKEESTDPRPDYILVGRDRSGADHLYRTTDETIIVIADAQRTHVQPLWGRSVDDWLQYVDDRRGWGYQRLFQSARAAWADALEPLTEEAP